MINWSYHGLLAPGGTVLAIAPGPAPLLLCEAGLVRFTSSGWVQLPARPPLALASTLAVAEQSCWVGGLGGIVSTTRTTPIPAWQQAWLDQVDEPVTCLLVSPRYARDRTLLAGSAGAGVLRSTDGGRRWHLSNFGLQDFHVLCLAAAGDWERRELVFAGTLDGVYRSPAGGRAWKAAGLSGQAVLALAADPRPDGTLLAASETGGLYRSDHSSRNWTLIDAPATTINALLRLPGAGGAGWLAGSADGVILRSDDDGITWRTLYAQGEPILSLAAHGEVCYAGLLDGGLLRSHDGGIHWHAVDELPGHGIARLRATPHGLLAGGPFEGLWLISSPAEGRQRLLRASRYDPVLDALLLEQDLLLARPGGIFRRTPAGEEAVLLTTDQPVIALAAGGPLIWAGGADGRIWQSDDRGRGWRELAQPAGGGRPGSLVCAPDGLPLAVVIPDKDGKRVMIHSWDGIQWTEWLEGELDGGGGQLVLEANGAGWAALGHELLHRQAQRWLRVAVCDAPITSLSGGPGGTCYLIAGNRIRRGDPVGCSDLPWPTAAGRPLMVYGLPTGELLCLDDRGGLWMGVVRG